MFTTTILILRKNSRVNGLTVVSLVFASIPERQFMFNTQVPSWNMVDKEIVACERGRYQRNGERHWLSKYEIERQTYFAKSYFKVFGKTHGQ